MDTVANEVLRQLQQQMQRDAIVKDAEELRVGDIKIKAKKAEKKGHLNDRDLANVMKHLKENDFIDNPRVKSMALTSISWSRSK